MTKTETAIERKRIERQIFKLRKEIEHHLLANNIPGVNQRLDTISALERELQGNTTNQRDNHGTK